jgi:hypothetical protein
MMESVYDEQPKGFDDYQITLGDILRGERATLGKTLLDERRVSWLATYVPMRAIWASTLIRYSRHFVPKAVSRQ